MRVLSAKIENRTRSKVVRATATTLKFPLAVVCLVLEFLVCVMDVAVDGIDRVTDKVLGYGK